MLTDNYKPVDSLFMLSQIVVEPFAELHSLSNEKQLMIFYCLIFHLLCRLLVSASGHKIGYDTFPTWHEHSFEYCTTVFQRNSLDYFQNLHFTSLSIFRNVKILSA